MAKNTNSNSKYPNKRSGVKVAGKYSYLQSQVTTFHALDEAMNQLSRHLAADEQTMIGGNMRTLMQDLEHGEVHYMTQMAVPSALVNKSADVVTTLRTFLKGVERLWVVHHKPTKQHVWEATYSPDDDAFSAFRLFSCDEVVLL